MKLKVRKIYLFPLRNGKRKLGYGDDPQHALQILSWRLTPEEMEQILPGEPMQIRQADLQGWVKELG